jgi:glycine/D-amino acid oxidase-like deaminating enzyme
LNRELTSALGLRWDGALCFDRASDGLAQRLERFRTFDYPVEAVSSRQFQGLEPNYREPPERALHSALEGAIEPVQATTALMDAAARLGARTIFGADVKALKRRAGKVIGVETDSGGVDAAVVVLAAGIGASPLLAGIGVHLPMSNRPGLMLHSKSVEPMVNHVIWGDRIHVKQQDDGRLVIGEIFSEGETEIDREAITEAMLAEVRRHLPGIDIEIERTTIGMRPIPEDGMPVVGHTGEVGGLYVAVMHSGITLAPIIGRMSAGEILDDVRFEALEPYRPGRFAKPA